MRRDLLTAYFDHLVVRVEDNEIHVVGERHEANNRIREISGAIQVAEGGYRPKRVDGFLI